LAEAGRRYRHLPGVSKGETTQAPFLRVLAAAIDISKRETIPGGADYLIDLAIKSVQEAKTAAADARRRADERGQERRGDLEQACRKALKLVRHKARRRSAARGANDQADRSPNQADNGTGKQEEPT
jgi:hypothetical protein